MFTGIVEAKGRIMSAKAQGKMRAVALSAPVSWRIAAGQSVAVDGVCLTAIKNTKGRLEVQLMGETLRKTTARSWKKGRIVNLERALRFGERLDGHFVLGHVEGTARAAEIMRDGASRLITFMLPAALARRVREKGSIAINGVSLTVARKRGGRVSVALVPYTLAHTNLGALKEGFVVNIETDALTSGRVSRNATRRARKAA